MLAYLGEVEPGNAIVRIAEAQLVVGCYDMCVSECTNVGEEEREVRKSRH
jgi:hypothetical protein